MLTGAPARVARVLLKGGPATTAQLARDLELTSAAVRRHLDELVAQGLVEASDRRPFGPDDRPKGRGRPARFYSLTQAGRDSFDQAYDDMAVGALRFMASQGGEDSVMAFARHRVAELERRYADLIDASELPAQRVAELADALASDGYAALVVPTVNGVQLCQNNCPVEHVASEFPQFCEAETEAFGRLLGTHVMRLATLAHGDGVCTTHIPTSNPGRPRPAGDPTATPAPVEGTTK